MKILSIIGTRPQFIKIFPICKAIHDYNKGGSNQIEHIIINTGQHFNRLMSDVFLEEMNIDHPEYDLNVVEKSNCRQVGKMIMELEKVLVSEAPDIVLVYGDTNSTLAGAIASKKLNFKLAHIEAGLRSFNRKMQEEINRITTDRISDILFCLPKMLLRI
jgi:UDP-GlcNAc3NAcA epimerase